MNDTDFIQQSAQLLYDLTVKLLESLKGSQPEIRGLHTKYLIYYLLFTIRQVQAICLLIGNNKSPYYAEQAGQLLRVLYEIYAKSSWMTYPDNDRERNHRAWRLEKASVSKEPLSDREKQELYKLLGITEYEEKTSPPKTTTYDQRYNEEKTSPLKQLPTIKGMLEEIGQYNNNYQIYSHESSTVHASLKSISKVANFDEENRTIIINTDSLNDQALRLTSTLLIFCKIMGVIIPDIGITCEDWEYAKEIVWHEITEMLNPLIIDQTNE